MLCKYVQNELLDMYVYTSFFRCFDISQCTLGFRYFVMLHELNRKISSSLSIKCWNVNGLFKRVNGSRICKLDDSDLKNNLNTDIVILVETHACENDVLKLNDYFCISNCRSKNISRKRGGVAVFVKQSLRRGIKIVDRKHPDMIWFKLQRNFFGFDKDLYINAVYISPVNSTYTRRQDPDNDIFQKLESDVTLYSRYGDIMLMGDMNAHINNNENDFIVNESLDNMEDFTPNNYNIDNHHILRNTQIPQTTNEYGKKLIELCISSQLRILNGRTLGDSVGKATYHGYNGSSIDDYCICNSQFLKNIVSFSVHDFDAASSDHCPILVKVRSFFNHQAKTFDTRCPRNLKWDENKRISFIHNISQINSSNLLSNMKHIASDPEKTDQTKADEMVANFNEILHTATSLKEHNDKQKYKRKQNKKKRKKSGSTMNA